MVNTQGRKCYLHGVGPTTAAVQGPQYLYELHHMSLRSRFSRFNQSRGQREALFGGSNAEVSRQQPESLFRMASKPLGTPAEEDSPPKQNVVLQDHQTVEPSAATQEVYTLPPKGFRAPSLSPEGDPPLLRTHRMKLRKRKPRLPLQLPKTRASPPRSPSKLALHAIVRKTERTRHSGNLIVDADAEGGDAPLDTRASSSRGSRGEDSPIGTKASPSSVSRDEEKRGDLLKKRSSSKRPRRMNLKSSCTGVHHSLMRPILRLMEMELRSQCSGVHLSL